MPRIVHTSDLHLDSRFESLPPDKARVRREELFACAVRMIALAKESRADLILIAGDYIEAGCVFFDTLEKLAALFAGAGVPILVSPGNHDFYGADSPWNNPIWPDNVHVFTTRAIERVDFPELDTSVYGAAFDGPYCESSMMAEFSCEEGLPTRIMLMHADITNAASPYNPVSEQMLADSGLTYFATGHIHKYSDILAAGRTRYAYPGCPEGRGFDETGPKGVIAGEISAQGCDLRFVSQAARLYHRLEVPLDTRDARQAALDALKDISPEDMARLRFTGEADDAPDPDALSEALSGRLFYLDFIDLTRPRRDLWAGSSEDSLRGLFLSGLRAQYDAAPSQRRRGLIRLAARFGLAALENRNPPQARAADMEDES